MDLLTEPVGFGFQDVETPRLRVYYPSSGSAAGVRDASPLSPPPNRGYPVVLFIHGDRRSASSALCPSDLTTDYKRWHAVLRLLPRCGLVVLSVDVEATIDVDPTAAAAAALEGLRWARGQWKHRGIIKEPPVIVDPNRPPPRPNVGAVGHSYGAAVAARLAAERDVRCVASLMGTWDDPGGGSPDLRDARVPTLFIAGMDDDLNAASGVQPFCEQVPVASSPRCK
jgi:pimeloyl-ACP methyl ester carboxylesterase